MHFKGSITIDAPFDQMSVILPNLQKVGGDLTISGSNELAKFSAPNLQKVKKTLKITKLTSLTMLELPSLEIVGTLNWNVLPLLYKVDLSTGISSAKNIIVIDTSLDSVENFFKMDILSIFNINNNRYLRDISAPLVAVTELLEVSDNSVSSNLSLPLLHDVNNITIRGVAHANLNSLREVKQSTGFIKGTYSSLEFPRLYRVGGTLSISQNKNLKEIYSPCLETISGGLVVMNNTELRKIDGFEELTTIGGAIEFKGSFNTASFKNLELVKGSASIISDSENFDCSNWTKQKTRGIIQGNKLVCESAKKSTVIDTNIGTQNIDSIKKVKLETEVSNNSMSFGNSNNRAISLMGGILIMILVVKYLRR